MKEFQKKVFAFICKYKLDNDGISPTLQQMADDLGKTRSQVYYACQKLAEGGYIEQEEGRIKVVIGKWIAQGELKDEGHFTWLDTDGELSDRVERAIMAYYQKYTRYPSVVLIHPEEHKHQTNICIDRHVLVPVVPSDMVSLRFSYKMPVRENHERTG